MTCSDKESSEGFIKANHKKTKVVERKLSKSYQVYQATFQERAHIFFTCAHVFYVVTHVISQEGTQEIQDSPPVLGDIWLQQLKNSTRSGSALISRKGQRMWFVRYQ